MGYKSIGKRLQMAREEAGFNQEQLAAKIGCSQSTLSNYEKGKRRIYLAQLDRIARTLNKPIEYFLQSLEDSCGDANAHRPAVNTVSLSFGNAGTGFKARDKLQEVRSDDFPDAPESFGNGEKLVKLYQSLSPEGKKLALEFIAWVKAKEVDRNG